MEKSVSGFATTGLWPFNDEVFADDEFAASLLTDEPISSHVPADQQPVPGRKCSSWRNKVVVLFGYINVIALSSSLKHIGQSRPILAQ